MTISVSSSTTTLLGDGSGEVFNFPFIAGVASNIVVGYTDTDGVLTTLLPSQYTLFLNPASPGQLWGVGGTVTYPLSGSPIATGTSITISRILPLTQTTSITDQGDFYPQTVERALDKLCMEIQQIAARTGQWRGTWATNTIYNYSDLVQDGANGSNSGNIYMCVIPNTSGTWATDLANGDWVLAIQAQLGSVPLPLSIANGGTGVTSIADLLAALGLGSAALANLSANIGVDMLNGLQINDGTVLNAMLANMAAHTVKANATAGAAAPQDIALTTNTLFGYGTAMGPIAIGSNLSMTGNTLSATGGGGGGGDGSIGGVLNCSYAVTDTTTLITPTIASWATAPLNTTVQNSITGASVAGSIVTLPVGKYQFTADFSPQAIQNISLTRWETRLRNTTDSATIAGSVRGEVTYSDGGSPISTFGYFEVTGSSKNFELQYYVNNNGRPRIGIWSTASLLAPGETINWVTLQFTKIVPIDDSLYIPSDTTGVSGADQITNIISLTQAEYDAIMSPDASTLYIIDG